MKQEYEILKRKRIKLRSYHEKLGWKRVKIKRIFENFTHGFVKMKTLQHKYEDFTHLFQLK